MSLVFFLFRGHLGTKFFFTTHRYFFTDSMTQNVLLTEGGKKDMLLQFSLHYSTDCENVVQRGRSGVIESLNFPDPYPDSEHCSWIIPAGSPGNRVNLTVTHYDLEAPFVRVVNNGTSGNWAESVRCYDYLEFNQVGPLISFVRLFFHGKKLGDFLKVF